MGIDIDRVQFGAEDFSRFERRLEQNLATLERLLGTPGFGEGEPSLGAELELYVVDRAGRPARLNQEILAAAGDPELTLELNRYNLEYNLPPFTLGDGAFSATEQAILDRLQRLGKVAAEFDARPVATGILPTLTEQDFGVSCVTDRLRYHALIEQLIARRGSDFRIDINGEQPLRMSMSDITLEGANTSFQVHYRVDPSRFADLFNAIQLATAPVLAIAGNSPTLFGHSLWHETRIPLFKQSIDTRKPDRYSWSEPARVNFGRGWVRRGALELFAEAVRLYPPLLPVSDDDPDDETALSELRLHQSTVWLWNRPVYDPAGGGHLRIEMRALPAGPTPVDMVANAAFLIGLAEGLRPGIETLLPAVPFGIAEYNFYRAAQHGLDANLVWPSAQQYRLTERPVTSLLAECLPIAAEGLAAIGVPDSDARRYLEVIRLRLAARQTGSSWQRRALQRRNGDSASAEALHDMLEEFMRLSASNLPVAEWPQ
jgi:gamma-glutamyl:cysteine ligase YbdK (ATP-grasp superfamily)